MLDFTLFPLFQAFFDGIATGVRLIYPLLFLFVLILSMSLITFYVIQPLQIKTAQKFTLAIATAPTLYGMLALFLSTIGVLFNPLLYLIPIILATLIGVHLAYQWYKAEKHFSYSKSHIMILLLTLFFILVIHLAWHHYMIVPAHIDSVQHSLLSNVLIQEQALPTHLPDAPDSGFVYHFGLHSLVSATYFLSQGLLTIPDIVLAAGIIILLCFSMGVSAFLYQIDLNYEAIICVLLLANFAFTMPMQLLNWGKYPVLLSFATFLPALQLFILTLKTRKQYPVVQIWVGIIMASLVIAHTRLLFIWMFVAVIASITTLIDTKSLLASLKRLLPYTFGLIFIVLAWIMPAWSTWYTPGRSSEDYPDYLGIPSNALVEELPYYDDIPPQNNTLASDRVNLYRLKPAETFWLLIIIVGTGVTGEKYLRFKLWILSSIIILLIMTLLPLPYIPGDYLLDPTWLYSFLVIPFTLLFGIMLRVIQAKKSKILLLSTFIFISVGLYLGVSGRAPYSDDCCQLVWENDMRAFNWMIQNIPNDAHFGIASYQWDKGDVVGYDGGYWISIITGQSSSLPSLFYGFSTDISQDAIESYALYVDNAVRTQDDLCSSNLTHIYAGNHSHSFSIDSLNTHPQLVSIYIKDGIAIFEISGCSSTLNDVTN